MKKTFLFLLAISAALFVNAEIRVLSDVKLGEGYFPRFVDAETVLRSHAFCSIWMCIVSYLETSRIPTLSLKKTKIKTTMMIPLLIIVALTANFLFTQTWLALGTLTIIYALSIPYSVMCFTKDKKAYLEQINE
mgnify:CR=1 FL=1